MSDEETRDRRVVRRPPSGSSDEGDTITGHHRVYRTPEGELVAVRVPPDLVDDDEVTGPTQPSAWSTIDWVLGRERPGVPPLAYIIGSVVAAVISAATAFGIGHTEHADAVSMEYVDSAVAECDHSEKLEELTAAVGKLTERVAVVEAGLDAHKQIPSHPGTLTELGRLSTDVAVAHKMIEVYHQ